jgi:hypothetical protein
MARSSFAVALIVVLSCIVGCSDAQQRGKGSETMNSKSEVSGAAIAAKVGLSLPQSAQYEYAEYMRGQDDAARIIFTLPVNEWEKLSKSAPFANAVYSSESIHHLGPDEGAWAPRKVTGLRVAQIPFREGKQSLNVGVIQLVADAKVRIFLFWYQL